MKSESFLTLLRQQHKYHFQGPEMKDIDKIVHVTWVVRNFMKLQEYFLYTKKLNNWYWREDIVE